MYNGFQAMRPGERNNLNFSKANIYSLDINRLEHVPDVAITHLFLEVFIDFLERLLFYMAIKPNAEKFNLTR